MHDITPGCLECCDPCHDMNLHVSSRKQGTASRQPSQKQHLLEPVHHEPATARIQVQEVRMCAVTTLDGQLSSENSD
jgi:hypothetical protein